MKRKNGLTDMQKKVVIHTLVSLAIAAPALAGLANAQDAALGQDEYMQRCAVCHGATGEGDGSVAELFTQRPSNLRKLAAENNGAFPFSEVYQTIDGRREVQGHGTSEMPVWGHYYGDLAIRHARETYGLGARDAARMVQGDILSLVYFLQSIQE